MPGFTTHYLFGVKLYKHLPKNTLKKSVFHHPCAYCLGLQGPDIFFYHPLSFFQGEKNMGSLVHTGNGKEFFSCMLKKQQQYKNLLQKEISTAYLLGFLSHLILDFYCHPYIYAKTHFQQNNLPYLSCHMQLETDIDLWLLEQEKQLLPRNFPLFPALSISKKQKQTICELLYFSCKETYLQQKTSFSMISHAIDFTRIGTRFLYDPFHRKKSRIKKLEDVLLGFPLLSCLMGSDDSFSYPDPCNLQKKQWKNPWDETKTSRDSFPELMHLAKETYFRILSEDLLSYFP